MSNLISKNENELEEYFAEQLAELFLDQISMENKNEPATVPNN